jgi:hypothetical protein
VVALSRRVVHYGESAVKTASCNLPGIGDIFLVDVVLGQ